MKHLIAPLAAACMVAAVATLAAAPARARQAAIQAAVPPVIYNSTLSMAQAIDLALRGNPDIAVARREVEALESEAAQAGHLPNPAIEYLREGVDNRNGNGNGATTVQLSVPIELGGKRAARRLLAGAALEQGRQVLAITRARVRAETVAACIELYLADDKLRLVQAGAALAASSTAAAARRVAAGKISPVEETRAGIAQAGAGIELLQAERDRDMARQRLRALLPPDAPAFDSVAAAHAPLPRLPVLAELMRKLDEAPALAQARQEVARRAALSQVELARRTPDLTVLLGSKRERSAGTDDGGRQLVLGLSVPLPLFDRNAGAVRAALSRLDQARDQQTAAAARLRLDLEQAHSRLAAALREVAVIDTDILPRAGSAFDAVTRGFEAGKFSYLDVLDAQRSLLNSRQQYVKAVGEAHRAAFDIAILTGTTP